MPESRVYAALNGTPLDLWLRLRTVALLSGLAGVEFTLPETPTEKPQVDRATREAAKASLERVSAIAHLTE